MSSFFLSLIGMGCPPVSARILAYGEYRGKMAERRGHAGRYVLFFKGRRSGYMPEYVDHPVKDWKTWEKNVKFRLNPETLRRTGRIGFRI